MVFKERVMSEKEKIPTIDGVAQASDAQELAWAFPKMSPGIQPLGGRVLVQLRRTKKTNGRIILVEETREAEKWNAQIAQVVSFGPLAYKNRDTMTEWPEGTWIKTGDFVRVPKWGGDRWERAVPNGDPDDDPVLFMILNDHEIISKVTDDPLSFKAFV
jgi:co-chaperonin GroES (HSP10)